MKGPVGMPTIIVLVLLIPVNSQNFVSGDVSKEIHCPVEKPFPCYPHMSCCGFDEYCSSKSSACEPCISFAVTKREEALKKCLKNEWTWTNGQCRFACVVHFEKEMLDNALKNVSSPKQTDDVPIINETPPNEFLLLYQVAVAGLSVILILLLIGIFLLVLTKTDWLNNRICCKDKDTSLSLVITHSSTENSMAQLGQSNGSMDTNCSTDDELKQTGTFDIGHGGHEQTNTAPTMAPDGDVPVHEAREEESPLLNRADDSPGHEGTNATHADMAAEQARLRGMHLNETNSDKFEVVTNVTRHQNSYV
ncbi:uncharacterized protein LOC106067839 isoform X2 [Biomphalaria glabrata]|uniref:Uncharacterized protein LOC106067839 isoform X2 n=1 Tax=Biomphalaria glabrata TaxID=6526 RepID=A0A9W2ZIU4_BIOGL|nr:uncharacterized protein LOC106067839 isoform X2 [Biomphalaria glabrata]